MLYIVNGETVMVPEGIDPGFAYRPGEQPVLTIDLASPVIIISLLPDAVDNSN